MELESSACDAAGSRVPLGGTARLKAERFYHKSASFRLRSQPAAEECQPDLSKANRQRLGANRGVLSWLDVLE